MIERYLALGLSRMGRITPALATLEGTGATCVEVDMWSAIDSRVERVAFGCWEWIGAVDNSGYGVLDASCISAVLGWEPKTRTGKRKQVRAHRVFWVRYREPIPEGMVLDHLCRNRICVNPEHLRVVTRAVNSTENSLSPTAINKGKTHCGKCGGELSTVPAPRPQRRCIPCRIAYQRKYYAQNRTR